MSIKHVFVLLFSIILYVLVLNPAYSSDWLFIQQGKQPPTMIDVGSLESSYNYVTLGLSVDFTNVVWQSQNMQYLWL